MILLATVATLFIREIGVRYGQSYRRAKITVATYLTLFSLSFLIRGTNDIFMMLPGRGDWFIYSAPWCVAFYFLTEWLPLCVIFSVHISQFRPRKEIILTPVPEDDYCEGDDMSTVMQSTYD